MSVASDIHAERALAEVALRDRPCQHGFEQFRRTERRHNKRDSSAIDYKKHGLLPIHRNVDSWLYVAEDPQLAVAVEEIVNTFNPNLSIELLLYNVLGSNSECATCLVRYLVNYYSSNRVCEHIKHTLRNMIRWTVLAGFVPCIFVPWTRIRSIGAGLSSKATLNALVSSDIRANRRRCCCSCCVSRAPDTKGGRPRVATLYNTLSPREAVVEAVQELRAHERALPAVLQVPLTELARTLRMLMSNSVPSPQASVVCKLVADWVGDPSLRLSPMKETELKMATVGLWGVMKTFEHGRCPVVPECTVSSCMAFFDTETGLVTAAVDGVLYRHIPIWESCWTAGDDFSTLAKRVHNTVKSWASLFQNIITGLTKASGRQVYTSGGADRSSLSHLADVILSSRGEGLPGLSGTGSGRPLDNLSRFMTANNNMDMFGFPAAELPDFLLRSGVGGTVSEHKSASVSHSLSKMMASMISEGQEVLVVRQFLEDVTRRPSGALCELKRVCKNSRLLQTAELIANKLEQDAGMQVEEGTMTNLGPDVKLVCSYPSTVSIAHLEETLSMWTNFWRSALSGFSQFNRRHNTIQYNNRDTVRELESGSPVHIFHSALVALLNTSGSVFADNLSGRKPDASLTVNDVMLTRDSLHPVAYGLLLANKLGLRPSDVRCEPDPLAADTDSFTSTNNSASSPHEHDRRVGAEAQGFAHESPVNSPTSHPDPLGLVQPRREPGHRKKVARRM